MSKPANPVVGECYIDLSTGVSYTWTGFDWAKIIDSKLIPLEATLSPTDEQLEKHPSLKQAWDEYLVIRKLLGI